MRIQTTKWNQEGDAWTKWEYQQRKKETMQKQPNRNNRVENVTEILKGFKKQIWSGRRQTQKTWISVMWNHQVKREKRIKKK